MKKLLTGLFVIILSFSCLNESYAQKGPWIPVNGKYPLNVGYISVGAHVGIINYYGDLNPWTQYASTDIASTRPSLGINVTRKISGRLHGRLAFTYGRLTASDFKAADPEDERHRYRWARNQHFRNDLFELSLVFMYDFKPNWYKYYKRPKFVPYALLGIAGFYHNPMAKTPVGEDGSAGKWVALRPLRTEGQGLVRQYNSLDPNKPDQIGKPYRKMYSLFQPTIPIGAGVKWKLTDRLDLHFEYTYRITLTDFLDDVSGNYADPRDLLTQMGTLSHSMANRTTELIDARKGDSRLEQYTKFTSEVNQETTDAAGLPTINGYGNDGDKRGQSNNFDVYSIIGFHLNYIVNVGLKCAKFH
jgi:hypothetical protein